MNALVGREAKLFMDLLPTLTGYAVDPLAALRLVRDMSGPAFS
jgi:hypothetical protein